jgi:clan AA aspartic protease
MAASMKGEVNASLEAVLELTLVGEDGLLLRVPAILDTGFDQSLLVPLSIVTTLGWANQGGVPLFQADGSSFEAEVSKGKLHWLGVQLELDIVVAGDTVLIGMALLRNTKLSMDVVEGGIVTIEPLPPTQ